MSTLSQVTFADGTTVAFESAEAVGPRTFSGGDIADPEQKLADMANGLHKVAESLREKLTPDEISIEAGVTFSAEAGIFFAKTAVEGNLTVSLTWTKPEPK